MDKSLRTFAALVLCCGSLLPGTVFAETTSAYLLIEIADFTSSESVEAKLGGLQNCKGSATAGHVLDVLAIVECNTVEDLNYAITMDISKVSGVKSVTLLRISN